MEIAFKIGAKVWGEGGNADDDESWDRDPFELLIGLRGTNGGGVWLLGGGKGGSGLAVGWSYGTELEDEPEGMVDVDDKLIWDISGWINGRRFLGKPEIGSTVVMEIDL